jgi:hypothetical protein
MQPSGALADKLAVIESRLPLNAATAGEQLVGVKLKLKKRSSLAEIWSVRSNGGSIPGGAAKPKSSY